MFISEIVQRDFIKWRPMDTVFISAPTGTGKTTFVLEHLLPYALYNKKRILYLCNRSILEQQLKAKLMERQGIPNDNLDLLKNTYDFDGISIMTYQRLQGLNEYALRKAENDFDYIIYDEIHYLLEDSAFNPYTYKLWEFIKRRGVSIFMSATLDDLPDRIIDKMYDEYVDDRLDWEVENEFLSKKKIILPLCRTIIHNFANGFKDESIDIPYTYVWYYNAPEQNRNLSVKYYEEDEEILKAIIDTHRCTEDKWLIFMSNKQKANKLCTSLEEYNISVEMFSAEDEKSTVRDEIIHNESFSTRVLVTTKVLDNGITLKDYTLKHIVIDTISKTEFLQMLGRKRCIEDSDSYTLYIGKKSLTRFTGYKNLECKKKIDFLNTLHTHKEICDKSKCDKEYEGMVKQFFYVGADDKFTINEWARLHYEKKYTFVCRMEKAIQKDEWVFIKEQLSWLDMKNQFDENNALKSAVFNNYMKELIEYLKNLCGQNLNKEEQEEFRNTFKGYLDRMKIKMNKKNRLPGLNVINKFLIKNNIQFSVESREQGGCTKWQIIQI